MRSGSRWWPPYTAANSANCWSPRATLRKTVWAVGASVSSPNRQPPKDLDFNVWLGPAPVQPYHENLVPYNWHWFWDTGNGEIGNQGVHQMDIARWAIGDRLPQSVITMGAVRQRA